MTMTTSVFTLLLLYAFASLFYMQVHADTHENLQQYEEQLAEALDKLDRSTGDATRLLIVDTLYVPESINQHTLKNQLEQALKHGDYASVSVLLRENYLTFSVNPKFAFILYVHPHQTHNTAREVVSAILEDNSESIRLALESNDGSIDEPVYMSEAMGESALNIAIVNAGKDVVKALLEAGADPNGFDMRTPMARAIAFDKLELVDLLLDYGADIEARLGYPANRPTLLSYAAATGNTDLIKMLLRRGASPDAGDTFGWTPLMETIHAQDEQNFELLLPVSNANINSRYEVKVTSTKGFDRSYPVCNALYVAEQIDSPLGEKFRKAILEKTDNAESSPESTLLQLQTLRAQTGDAADSGNLEDAQQLNAEAWNLINTFEINSMSSAELVNQAISVLLWRHELSVATNNNLKSDERGYIEYLFSIGSNTKKWHDMLDVMHAALLDYPKAQLEQWKRDHGAPSRQGWDFSLLHEWIESTEDVTVRDRLYDTLDFFELN